jgi:hypothetical protein
LAEVAAFQAVHGHCEVPSNHPENPKLADFVRKMRTQRKKGTLSAQRIAKLDALGFAWKPTRRARCPGEPISALWKMHFDELLHYQDEHGGCNVPSQRSENRQLGRWVCDQRSLRKAGALHPERQRLLDEIGFEWRVDRSKEAWTARFEQLKSLKERFGHCRVPRTGPGNSQLLSWVYMQRHFRKHGRLSPERCRLLDEIGFV